MPNVRRILLALILCLLCSCTPATPSQRVVLPLPDPGEQVSFTLRQSGRKLIHIEIEAAGTRTQTTFTAIDAYAPAWLRAAGGTIVIQTDGTTRVIVDGDCTRPADDIPLIEPAAIIGPQPGFVADPATGKYHSHDGSPLWDGYEATAAIADGAVRALNARGSGSVLLPDNTTRSGEYDWIYQRSILHRPFTPVVTPCQRDALETFPLPPGTTERTIDSGMLTGRHPDSVAAVADLFTQLLADSGTLTTLDASPTRITVRYSSPSAAYIVLLDADTGHGTRITVYRAD